MSSEFWASLWKNFCSRSILNHTLVLCGTVFVDKNFMVCLSSMKTTKILPPEKYPLYGSTCKVTSCKMLFIQSAFGHKENKISDYSSSCQQSTEQGVNIHGFAWLAFMY